MYQSLECRPDSYQEWYKQGNKLRAEGYYQEALMSYERAINYKPRDYWSWYRKGVVLEALDCYSEAIDSYTQANNIEPNNYWAWYEQGCILFSVFAEYQRAIACFERALVAHSQDYWAIYRIAEAHRKLGNYEEAISHYDQALKLRPQDFWAFIVAEKHSSNGVIWNWLCKVTNSLWI